MSETTRAGATVWMVEHIPVDEQEDHGPYYRARSFAVVATSARDAWITVNGMGGRVVARHAVFASQADAWDYHITDLKAQIESLVEEVGYAERQRREATR